MVSLQRGLALVSILVLGLLSAQGCGSGASTEDAELQCKQFQTANATCVTDAAYKQCLSCEEECGDDCIAEPTCPATYKCPD